MQAVILVGEIRIGEKGAVHQDDFALALGAERLTSIPKHIEPHQVAVIVGKPLRGKMPSIVERAKAKEIPVLKVTDVLDAATGRKLMAILKKRDGDGKLYGYERAAMTELQQSVQQRRKKASKVA